MSTQINVTVGKAGLSDKAKQQTDANRQAKLEADARDKANAEGKRQRAANFTQQGIGPDGKPLYGQSLQATARRDEPAAYRAKGRGDFGWISELTFPSLGDAYTAESRITTTTPITFRRKGNYGVIKVGTRNFCSAGTSLDTYFAGKRVELVNFARSGGVVWVQNEWLAAEGQGGGCGIPAAEINPYIQQAFGTTMTFESTGETGFGYDYVDVGVYGSLDKNALVYAASGVTAPLLFYTNRTGTISGGTPLYASAALATQESNSGVVVAFERIGKGFLVLSGDSNATASYPIGIYEGQPYTFIDALRTLR